MLETRELTKRYGDFLALRGATLDVAEGECVGVLGPNGAGKSTLFRLLMGFIRPTSGTAKVAGFDCQKQLKSVHEHVAYLPGDVRLFGEMRGRGVLEFFADIHPRGNRQKSLETAERLELDLTRRVAFMSTGMRQKLGLAIALSNEAPLIIMDEPTTSLDPNVRSEVIRMIGQAHKGGRTVMICSHVLSEIEDICDRVLILRSGDIVHDQCLVELRRRYRVFAKATGNIQSPPPQLTGQIENLKRDTSDFQMEVVGDLQPVLGWLAVQPIVDLRIQPHDLREVYERYHHPAAVPARTTEPATSQVASA